ncbi:MAG: YHYH protein [Acidobacteriia bacterium]|nr:YHYH protein [Terriglobia bacterium]
MIRTAIAALFALALIVAGAAERRPDGFDFDPEFVAQSFQGFSADVSVRWDEDYFYIESNAMPRHRMMVGIRSWNRQVPLPQPYFGDNAFRLPLRPRFAEEPVSARHTLFRGAIAVAANGVPIFNPIKQDGRTDTYLAGELDEFGGHAGRADDYHYHVAPVHLADRIGGDVPIAWALDGFPIFGYDEPDGSQVRGLDWLNGHSPPGGPYHYHATPEYPRVNGGFRGQLELRNGEVAIQPRARGVRPFTRPLRGATVTGFEIRSERSYHLEFEHGGQSHGITYALLPDGGAEFVFTDGAGRSHTEAYSARRARTGGATRTRQRQNPRPERRD